MLTYEQAPAGAPLARNKIHDGATALLIKR
jgi:hypothetical protein